MVGTLNSRQDYNSHAFLLLLKTCRTATIGSLPPPRSSFPSSVPLNTWYFSQEGRAAKPCCRNHPLQAVQPGIKESHQRSGGTQEGKSQNRNPRLALKLRGQNGSKVIFISCQNQNTSTLCRSFMPNGSKYKYFHRKGARCSGKGKMIIPTPLSEVNKLAVQVPRRSPQSVFSSAGSLSCRKG